MVFYVSAISIVKSKICASSTKNWMMVLSLCTPKPIQAVHFQVNFLCHPLHTGGTVVVYLCKNFIVCFLMVACRSDKFQSVIFWTTFQCLLEHLIVM